MIKLSLTSLHTDNLSTLRGFFPQKFSLHFLFFEVFLRTFSAVSSRYTSRDFVSSKKYKLALRTNQLSSKYVKKKMLKPQTFLLKCLWTKTQLKRGGVGSGNTTQIGHCVVL